MTAVEAVLLLIGVVFLIGSFFVMEKLSPEDISKVAELSEEELRVVMDRELGTASAKVADLVDEAMDLTVDRVQRTMERDTNEKIMAISEYSDSAMEQMKKMNQEISFLYSMLGDKHVEINEAMEKLDELMQEYEELRVRSLTSSVMPAVVQPAPKTPPVTMPKAVASPAVPPVAEPAASVADEDEPEDSAEAAVTEPSVEYEDVPTEDEPETMSVRDRILECYRDGESVTDIARKLGLGIGEVKLIVDLYRGESDE